MRTTTTMMQIRCDICTKAIHALGETWEVRGDPTELAPAGTCLIRACAECGPGIGARPTWHWDDNAELLGLGLGKLLLPADFEGGFEPFADLDSDLLTLPA